MRQDAGFSPNKGESNHNVLVHLPKHSSKTISDKEWMSSMAVLPESIRQIGYRLERIIFV